MGGYPLLLTGTIDSSVYSNTGNIISDLNIRLQQYEHSIERYIVCSPFDKIIFIENSGFNFDARRFMKLASDNNKSFEFIQGKICVDEIIKYGKSYGDAFLISEALDKSQLLKNETIFYKMTGRIFLRNAKQLVKTRDRWRNEFYVYPGIHWCLTYFFKANVEDYKKYLYDSFLECNEKTVNDIEIVFYRRLMKLKDELEIRCFSAFPWIDGKMGATGRDYSGGIFKRTAFDIMAKFGVFTFYGLPSRVFWLLYRTFNKNKAYDI